MKNALIEYITVTSTCESFTRRSGLVKNVFELELENVSDLIIAREVIFKFSSSSNNKDKNYKLEVKKIGIDKSVNNTTGFNHQQATSNNYGIVVEQGESITIELPVTDIRAQA